MPDDPTQQGRWEAVLDLPDVAVHTHVLHTGKVLVWGRRKDPNGGMHQQACAPFVWDPATGGTTPTPEPRRLDGATPANLFCSGHTFLADGRLLVAGGHVVDGDGLDQVCVYDPVANTWTPLPTLRSGRWYPSALTLSDGRVLVLSGTHQDGPDQPVERIPEIWDGTAWHDTREFTGLPLYPRVHLLPDGRVLMSGSNRETKILDTAGPGEWTDAGVRVKSERQYAPSVMYEPGKVLYIGGGNDPHPDRRPTADCERIDFAATAPGWAPAASMTFRRRQHNATLLPDGTVLVTGGTGGRDFNDLTPGSPIRAAELWDPTTDSWSILADEAVDRCYHSTAVLLPDATVLSAGGGEFVDGGVPNPPEQTHRDAQVFRPPYLFRGPRPVISAAPDEVAAGEAFTVTTDGPEVVAMTLVRPSSTTHAFDGDQRFLRLEIDVDGRDATVTAPASSAVCPPGYYMVFALSGEGVPSTARFLRIGPAAGPQPTLADAAEVALAPPSAVRRRALRCRPSGTAVTVGLTAQCPYGLGPCWGGAYSALTHLHDVAHVDPVPSQVDQTARVILVHTGLPDLARWPEELARSANASYLLRGVEVTLAGKLVGRGADLLLDAPGVPQPLPLRQTRPGSQLAWDLRRRRRRPVAPDEREAYQRLLDHHRAGASVTITGPLSLVRGKPALSVRTFTAES